MKFRDFLAEDYDQSETENISSAATIKTAFDNAGFGLDLIRQTATKENTASSVYKENGFSVNAFWIMEDGPMSEDGYSESDAKEKLAIITEEFRKLGGNVTKTGTIVVNNPTVIAFNDFKITLDPLMINSALDGSGFNRTYLKVEVK